MRADFRCTAATHGERIVWRQELEGTPFERFLKEAELELRLEPGATERDRADAARRAGGCAASRGSARR